MTAILTTHNLTLGYDRHPAVHHLDLSVESGALIAVVGPNGAGKTTMLKGLCGLAQPLGGHVHIQHGKRIAYLSQRVEIDTNFPISVRDFVIMGLWSQLGALGWIGGKARTSAAGALEAVRLGALADRPIGTLSGGELRRALFARLMLQDADIILLDEPFTAVDADSEATLLAVIMRWHGEGRTVLAVLHDRAMVTAHFPQALVLSRRQIAFGDTATVLTDENWALARDASLPVAEPASICQHDAGHHHEGR